MTKLRTWNGAPVADGLPLEELEDRLKHSGPMAWNAMVALARQPQPRAIELLSKCARSPDCWTRRLAIEAISHHQLAHTAPGVVCAALHDPSRYVIRAACQAAAKLALAEAHDGIQALLSSRDALVRETAVRALSGLWQAQDFTPVLRVFRSDPSQEIRRAAAWTLRETAGAATWRELFNVWKGDELPRHRVWACQIAGLYGDDSVRAELETLARDRDGHVRKAAVQASQQRV